MSYVLLQRPDEVIGLGVFHEGLLLECSDYLPFVPGRHSQEGDSRAGHHLGYPEAVAFQHRRHLGGSDGVIAFKFDQQFARGKGRVCDEWWLGGGLCFQAAAPCPRAVEQC